MMFRGKQRPKGLEFPTCAPCNHGSSHADLVASLIGRFDPDAGGEQGQRDFLKLLSGINNNIPGLLDEMKIGRAGQKLALRRLPPLPAGSELMRVDGPLVKEHMKMFAAKLGFALHYEMFGTPVPAEGGVQPMWFTNVQVMTGDLPIDLLSLLPSMQTLKQGRMEVSDQFQYTSRRTEEGRHSLFYGKFWSAFAVAAVTAMDRSEFLERNAAKFPLVLPGAFKSADCKPAAMSSLWPHLDHCGQ
jgi:hypothetical protein